MVAIPDAVLLVATGFVTLLVALGRAQRARAARGTRNEGAR